MASETVSQRRGTLSTLANIVGILMGIAFIVAVGLIIAMQTGLYTPPALEAPVPTVRTLPTTAPAVPAQAVPTSLPVAPTALPQGQPAAPPIQADPAAPAMAAPATGPNPAAPETIKARGPICFAGIWYVDGQNTEISCSGTGGD